MVPLYITASLYGATPSLKGKRASLGIILALQVEFQCEDSTDMSRFWTLHIAV